MIWYNAFVTLPLFATALAAQYDPDLTWRTITTDHFHIHFHQGEEQLADEFSVMVEEVYDTMLGELRWEPLRRTDVVLVDRTDQANGYASVVPTNQIVIYVTAPQEDSSLSLYEDWSTAIATHELTHILHMDANHGIVRAARAVVGRIASTNDLSPWWLVEGFATFQETRHTSGGRGRSLAVDMYKRTYALADEWPPLGNMDGLQADPPSGNLRYLWGQDFIQYVSDHQGEDVWTRWVHIYGSHVPYWLPAKKVFGKRLVPLYFDWKEDRLAHYRAVADSVEAEGIREGRLVSDPEQSCWAPRFAPDGAQLVWSCYDLRTGSAIWKADAEGANPEILLEKRGAKNFTWRRDSGAFVYASTHVVNRFNTWSDIHLYDIEADTTSPLTAGARARDPDFSPDGSRLVVVTNRVQNTNLEVMTVDRIREPLTARTDHTQFATPRYSPDGKALAVSVWSEGRRDLWLYGTDGTPLRRLTADAAIDRDPEWSPDGRWLFFVSDRSGIPNVYAIEVENEHLWQVTNVVTGAAGPSVRKDVGLLAYQQHSVNGWQVRLLELDPGQWLDRGTLPAALVDSEAIREIVTVGASVEPLAVRWEGCPDCEQEGRIHGVPWDPVAGKALQDPDATDTFEQAKAEDVFGEEADYPFKIAPRRYTPFPTLLPRFVAPWFLTTDRPSREPFQFLGNRGVYASLSTSATDPLRHFVWAGSVNYRTDADFVGGSGAVILNRWLPVYSMGGGTAAVPSGVIYTWDPEDPFDETGATKLDEETSTYWERRITGWAQVTYPYTYKSSIFGQYSITQRQELDPLPENAYLPQIPVRGTIGKVSGGWRYAWGEPTAYAISQEDAQVVSLVGSVLAPWLGTFVRDDQGNLGPLTQFQITAEGREYVVNPWVPNHVLALRGGTGLTVGATDFLGNYQLGGSFGDSAFVLVPSESRMLRGYPTATDIGDLYWLAGAEYRFPLWRIERGIGTIPAYARTLSGAVFVDSGNAFSRLQTIADATEGTMVGVGAELNFSTVVLWSSGISLRGGYAMGLTEGGYWPADAESLAQSLYLQVGGSF